MLKEKHEKNPTLERETNSIPTLSQLLQRLACSQAPTETFVEAVCQCLATGKALRQYREGIQFEFGVLVRPRSKLGPHLGISFLNVKIWAFGPFGRN